MKFLEFAKDHKKEIAIGAAVTAGTILAGVVGVRYVRANYHVIIEKKHDPYCFLLQTPVEEHASVWKRFFRPGLVGFETIWTSNTSKATCLEHFSQALDELPNDAKEYDFYLQCYNELY